MRVVFAGSSGFALAALEALHGGGHAIAAVYTQPDRPAGRGRKLQPTPVAVRAAGLGLETRKPARLDAGALAALRELAPEVMVVVAYGLILPAEALAIPRHGCLNIHASLLPRWRGAAPIARSILAGDAETGITIMRMDAGLDTGPILLQERVPIRVPDSAADLHDRLAPLGGRLMLAALERLGTGGLAEQPQPASGVTYAPKLTKEEARLDWSLPAEALARRVRGYFPAPVAWTELDGERIRIAAAEALDAGRGPPGQVLRAGGSGIEVGCGTGALRIRRLQRPGGSMVDAAAAASGWKLEGKRFR